jgi:NIPSNAP
VTTHVHPLGIASAVAFASAIVMTFAAAASPQKPVAATASASSKNRVFELRTYYTHPGKLDALNKRFSDHTCRIFQKHGIELVGFWTPQDEKDGKADKLVYVLAFPSRDAAKASWKAFGEDPEWKSAKAESEKAGPIVKKVESVFLDPTDYSPIK